MAEENDKPGPAGPVRDPPKRPDPGPPAPRGDPAGDAAREASLGGAAAPPAPRGPPASTEATDAETAEAEAAKAEAAKAAGIAQAEARKAERAQRVADRTGQAKAQREAKVRAKVAAKAAKKAAAAARRAEATQRKGHAPVLHSLQLDERLRRGDAEIRPIDVTLKRVLDGIMFVSLGLIVLVLVGRVGIGLSLGIQQLTYIETLIAAMLMGAGFIFDRIRWRALRGSHGQKILEKWKADLQLTIVSILALFTVIFILVVEVLALLAFVQAIDVGEAGARFAGQFVLLAAIILLVQVMAFVVREYNLSSYKPHPRAVTASNILTPVAGFFMLAGLVLATGLPQRAGLLADIEVRQAVYVLTVGVGLEFLAMRVRLRLPSVYSLFMAAVDVSRRANEEMRVQLNKRAMRTYVFASVFVALSMAFAGAAVTGNVALEGGRLGIALAIFYVGFALILLGLILVRVFQARNLNRKVDDTDDLSRLVGQKRKSATEIARMGIYAISALVAGSLLVFSVVLFATAEEIDTVVPVLDDDGEPLVERGEPVTRIEKHSESAMGIRTTYATDVLILAIVAGAGPYGFFFNRELRRIEAIDEKFPDFLRDLAESARAGMTLPRALVSASKGTYGALTDDIQQMAAQVEWGVDFGDALERFAQRAKTPLIDRTVALVVEAQRAGGNVIDVLTAASEDAREIKQIVAERTEQMKMYNVVVFISFFVFITVVMILAAQFLPAFKEAVDAATAGGQPQDVGGIKLAPFDVQKFNDIFFHGAVIMAIGGSLVGGVMTRGHPVAGFNSMFIMLAAAWVSFRVVLQVMTG